MLGFYKEKYIYVYIPNKNGARVDDISYSQIICLFRTTIHKATR